MVAGLNIACPQMLMYYNLFFSVVYFVVTGSILVWKMQYLTYNIALRILEVTVFALWCLVEPMRLYLGHCGCYFEYVIVTEMGLQAM